jgi:hypothetical protein
MHDIMVFQSSKAFRVPVSRLTAYVGQRLDYPEHVGLESASVAANQ